MSGGILLLAVSMVVSTNTSALAQKGRKGRGNQFDAVKNGWLSSLAEGKARASKTNKPLMVVMRCVP
ncbi:MAG TPA: hypothetical protein VKE98_08295 [Gemmataceae bacterium]|nr:hypothetical protein [Gemmataceae bacterium]